MYLDVNGGEGGRAKFTEYGDMKEPVRVFGTVEAEADSEKHFLKFDAYDMGYDTQSYQGSGGMYGKFKLDLFYDEIPHNVTFDARTPYSGIGTDTLTSGAPPLNPDKWNTFDYSTKRKNAGGEFKLNAIKPFFFNTSYTREEKKGFKPAGLPAGSPGSFFVEWPEPINYTTNNYRVEGGYGLNPLFVSFNYLYSDFSNNIHTEHFVGYPVASDESTLPPDNTLHRFNLKGAYKLPYNSKFAANVAYGENSSEHDLFTSFDGDVKTTNADVVFTTNPIRLLDTKAYYKYYNRDNDSTQTLLPEAIAPTPFDYKINTFGFDFGLNLPAKLYLTPGYKYVKTEREYKGEDTINVLPYNTDNIYSVELKWKGLDWITPKLGYEMLDRGADFRTFGTAVGTGSLINRFAYSPQNRDTFKVAFDFYPADALSFGAGYKYRIVNYEDDILPRISGLTQLLGLKSDKRNEVNFNADYTLKKYAKFFAYFDYELINSDQTNFKVSAPRGFWSVEQDEETYDYGIGTDIYVIPDKLTFTVLHDYIKSNGNADLTIDPSIFATFAPAGVANNDNVDTPNWDDYTKWGLTFKGTYYYTKSIAFAMGYSYQELHYSSAELDEYQFVNPAGGPIAGSNGGLLSGAFKDQSYVANIFFASVSYRWF